MLETKTFEVRDSATFLPVIATRITRQVDQNFSDPGAEAEDYLLGRSGYSLEVPLILMTPLIGGRTAEYEAYAWNDRTLQAAHLMLQENWDDFETGDVVDVRVFMGEATEPVVSERLA